MSITLEALRSAITPSRTALILGAGASVPSGAPNGEQLAASLWKKVAGSDPQSNDFLDTASILVHRHSRRPVVDAVVATLRPLRPTGGILALPQLGWSKLFTTNFDLLVEASYKEAGIPLVPIRSNYDFTTKERETGTRLYKIHGCITQDESLGHKASMLLTEDDSSTHKRYRQALFAELQASLLAQGDVLIIGQSLRDRHLSDLVREVLSAKMEGAPGNVYVLVYDRDDIRAPLLESKGARIAFGGLDEFLHVMATSHRSEPVNLTTVSAEALPLDLVGNTFDVEAQARLSPNIVRMFNGGPASYADIAAGATFERARYQDITDRLNEGDALVVGLIGAAGVGKTTFARQILYRLREKGMSSWEHRTDFPFDRSPWINVEKQLRTSGKRGVLLLDECTRYLRETNELINRLAELENPSLRILLTANSSQWAPRIKSPNIFAKGIVNELSRLEVPEINSLLNLLAFNQEIARLVHSDFKRLSRAEQFDAPT